MHNMRQLGLRRLFQNSAGTLVRQLGAGILQLLTVVVIARALGPQGNGQFAIAILLPTLMYRFFEMGMPTANAHFIGNKQVSVRTAFNTSLRWSSFLVPTGLTLGTVAIWLMGHQWFPGVPQITLWIALSVYPVLLIQTFLASLFQGLQDFKSYNLVLLLQPAITLGISLVMVMLGQGTTTLFVIAYLIGALVTLLVSYTALRRYLIDERAPQAVEVLSPDWPLEHPLATGKPQPTRSAIKAYSQRITRYALKSHLSIALAFFNYRVDVYLLNFLGDTAGTGVYVIATQMVEKIWLLSSAVSVVMLPLLSQLGSEEDKRRKITPLLYLWVSLLTAIAGGLTALLAVPIVLTLFGEGYGAAALIMQILLPGIVAWSGARVLAQDLTARGKPELNIYMNSGVLVVNVVGNLLLIPKYGMLGAAIATTVAYCLFAIQMLIFYSKIARTNWKSAVLDSLEFSKSRLRLLVRE